MRRRKDALTDAEIEALYLHEIIGLSEHHTARKIGISRSAVQRRLRRAIAWLRDIDPDDARAILANIVSDLDS
jgi:predicted DNA-binding protein (UPF0251 family)